MAGGARKSAAEQVGGVERLIGAIRQATPTLGGGGGGGGRVSSALSTSQPSEPFGPIALLMAHILFGSLVLLFYNSPPFLWLR